MGRILVGVSSWAEPELIQSGFYPQEIKTPAQRLTYYASQFPLAEIDSSYHFLPTRRMLASWLDNAPEGFIFDPKAFSLFTRHPTPLSSLPRAIRDEYGAQIQTRGNAYLHHLPEQAISDLWSMFLRTIESLDNARKLGAVLFQFPPWFHPEPENYEHMAWCRDRLAAHPMAVEFRVGSWLDKRLDETLGFLRRQGIALVCVDEPQGLRSSVPPVSEVTASVGVVRFHGRNRDNWEGKGTPSTERFRYLYTEAELKVWAQKIRSMAKKADELHVIFKNKHADFPVTNALQMKSLLGLT